MVERLPVKQMVIGSNPVSPANILAVRDGKAGRKP